MQSYYLVDANGTPLTTPQNALSVAEFAIHKTLRKETAFGTVSGGDPGGNYKSMWTNPSGSGKACVIYALRFLNANGSATQGTINIYRNPTSGLPPSQLADANVSNVWVLDGTTGTVLTVKNEVNAVTAMGGGTLIERLVIAANQPHLISTPWMVLTPGDVIGINIFVTTAAAALVTQKLLWWTQAFP